MLTLILFKKFETGTPKTQKITAILGAWLGLAWLGLASTLLNCN
jgi:TM2 domain-containing membrane protein YozV